jgi:hypothetical protein
VYPVAATLLDLEVPDTIASDGGPLREILRAPQQSSPTAPLVQGAQLVQ